jgi:uncharacterized protein YhdP
VSDLRAIERGFALLQYGGTMAWGRQAPAAERPLLPSGEGQPPLDYWLDLLDRCATVEDGEIVLDRARAELESWRRRPEPPPAGESLDDLKARILREGQGWTPKEVALAMRVTPTLVRNVRTEAERDPEYGRPDGSLAHGLALLDAGCSIRQAAQITGIPKSTLHDAHRTRLAA